jgi:hypothetical protein
MLVHVVVVVIISSKFIAAKNPPSRFAGVGSHSRLGEAAGSFFYLILWYLLGDPLS